MTNTKKQSHTQEPWEFRQSIFPDKPPVIATKFTASAIFSKDNTVHSFIIAIIPNIDSNADGKRIVDCVNALEGIKNPAAIGELIEAAQDFMDNTSFEVGRNGKRVVSNNGFTDLQTLYETVDGALAALNGEG